MKHPQVFFSTILWQVRLYFFVYNLLRNLPIVKHILMYQSISNAMWWVKLLGICLFRYRLPNLYAHYFFPEFVRPTAENMTYCYATGAEENRRGSRSMLIIDEMFIILVRIKLGLFIQDLAFRFQLHMSTVSGNLTAWVNYLYFLLGTQPIWPPREEINVCMPDQFKQLYPSTQVILDCTKLFVQLYSSYKSNTALTCFITYRAKLLNADWFRQRAFFLNFPSTEGKITRS